MQNSSQSPKPSKPKKGASPRSSDSLVSSSPSRSGVRNKIELLPFKEALGLAGKGKRHLMLGNGFSIALRPDIFTYNTLFETAKESDCLSDELAEVFQELGTTDFEVVMESLQNAATLVKHYESANPALARKLEEDAAQLRDVLAETIAKSHPARPYDVSDEQYGSCKSFLQNFDGNIYTLNYDLLLYWTLMQSELEPQLESDDGFRHPEDGEEEFVVWDVQNTNDQRIFYLHGALHIYDAGADLLKFTWSKTEIALVDQIKRSLAKREYPLIVTEGTSAQKMDRIQHSSFLGRAYRSFSAITGNLFIYGHSLAENDEHLLKLIDKRNVNKIFVGIYGDASTKSNRRIIERAQLIPGRRSSRCPAEVLFFDAESAHVWDGQGVGAGGEQPRRRPK